MSSKDEKAQAAAERIKAQALSQAKGLSRAQAERAAAAAARNVNAYGQKEEGPSRWQERKEAKRQMYLMSTEKAVTLGERKDLKAPSSSSGGVAAQCQRCLQPGHWTYECKNEAVYISRPSRTQQLKNPKLRMRPTSPLGLENPGVENGNKREKPEKSKAKSHSKRAKRSKRKHRSGSDSESESSEASVFESDSDSSVTESGSSTGTSSSYSSSDSEDQKRRRRRTRKQKRTHRRRDSSSDSSDSESASESDSDDSYNQRKSRRHRRRR
ncbi:unnamed protein product [Spirodela intermedia]|uniref:Uncharacterized protein n=1 Tax=Spirodela intermedia TaxID=51605 RepID=A0A7I8IVH9_SPIIN|nr:unnamed protein product [Spirodela intermedia]CAA6661996.1 unnamed protein product [Spirodela intermedia]